MVTPQSPTTVFSSVTLAYDSNGFTWVFLRLQLNTKANQCHCLNDSMWFGGMTNKEIHSECLSFLTQACKLHRSKPFLVLHPLRSSQIKKQDKPKYSLQRKIENSSFLWHENISGVYIWCETVSIHVRQNSLCLKARKSQIKCEATSGLNFAHKTRKQTKQNKQLHFTQSRTWHDRQQQQKQSYLVS